MGKSPGKWIKTVLFGKKSKSNGSKGRERVSNEKAVLVAAKAAETDVSLEPSLVANQVPDPADGSINKLEVENNGATNISDDDVPGNQYTNSQKSTSEDVLSDSEKEHQEKAATAVQAAFRGYLARRAFWALKGIIRLQALIRGHLVRRQAVSTLCCTMGIVKLQALVRGRQIRHSVIGVEIQRKCSQGQTLKGKLVVSLGSDMPSQIKKLSTNAFVSKLLASSPTVMPLHLHYDSSDPNSVLSWLERWSASRFWKPVCQPKKMSNSKSQRKHTNGHIGETETGRPKRSVRKVPAANFDSISAVQATFEFEKPKRIYRKLSGHPADLVQDNPQSELEKVKRNLRKVHNPVLDNSVQSEVEFEKPKLSVEKVSATSTHDPPEQGMNHSGEKIRKETILAVAKQTEVETIPVPLEVADTLDLSCDDQDVVESKPLIESESKDENVPTTNGELNQKEDLIGNENKKSSRKASTAAKQEFVENGVQHSPTVPSYMQATESAKAKLRLQGSPRSGLDAVEKNNVTRRHSLPSSANSKISSQSPRTHRVVHAGAKGGNKSEKSLSARDGNAKVAQAEWRR